jgi:hypothetical protein
MSLSGTSRNSPIPDSAPRAAREFAQLLHRLEQFGIALLSIGVFGTLILASTPHGKHVLTHRSLNISSSKTIAGPVGTRASGSLRFVYQYSVIPGGVQSVDELRDVIMNDPVVAQHYADFDVGQMKFVTMDRDTAFYVSYRLHSGVYWTTQRLIVHRGERLMTDGINLARARCGNRLAALPLLPITRLEPTAEEMGAASVVRAPDGTMEAVHLSRHPFGGFIPIPPFFLPPSGGGFTPIFSFAPIPAPSGWVAFLIFLVVVILRWLLLRRIAVERGVRCS